MSNSFVIESRHNMRSYVTTDVDIRQSEISMLFQGTSLQGVAARDGFHDNCS